MPGAAQKAFQLSIDPNAEARDFIEVIESDEGLSARVLKIANSVYFDRGNKSSTIEESVTVIGINELRCLLNANSLSEIFPTSAPARTHFWAHDIGTALAARLLSQRILPSKSELAFLGGLMHDVGKLLLIQRNLDEYNKILQQVEREGGPFTKAEEQRFPFDHTEVGQLIGERWNFSPELLAMIRNHHKTWDEVVGAGPSLVGIIKAADIIAHALGLGHPATFNRVRAIASEQLPETWNALGIPEGESKAILDRVRRSYETEYDLYAGQR